MSDDEGEDDERIQCRKPLWGNDVRIDTTMCR